MNGKNLTAIKKLNFSISHRIELFKSKYFSDIRIALVRLDAIGDFVLWLDTAKEYRQLYPNKKITLIANSVWADFAKKIPYWDEVWPIEIKIFSDSRLYRWRTLLKIYSAKFEIAIQPTYSRTFLGDRLIRATKAPHRIGSISDFGNITPRSKAISNNWYTRLIPATNSSLMELERNSEFFTHLSGSPFKAGLPKLPHLLNLPANLKVSGDYIIIFPGASWIEKRWSINNFSQLIDKLTYYLKYKVVLCGSSDEVDLCQDIANTTKTSTLNFAGKTSLAEFAEIVRSARLLVANDTSAIHIANAVETLSVCLLGGGHYGRFLPYPEHLKGLKPLAIDNKMPCFNCNWQCTVAHDLNLAVPCITSITVEQVLKAILHLTDN